MEDAPKKAAPSPLELLERRAHLYDRDAMNRPVVQDGAERTQTKLWKDMSSEERKNESQPGLEGPRKTTCFFGRPARWYAGWLAW